MDATIYWQKCASFQPVETHFHNCVLFSLMFRPPIRPPKKPQKNGTSFACHLILFFLSWMAWRILLNIYIYYILHAGAMCACACTALIVCHSQKRSGALWMHMLWKFEMIHIRSVCMWMFGCNMRIRMELFSHLSRQTSTDVHVACKMGQATNTHTHTIVNCHTEYGCVVLIFVFIFIFFCSVWALSCFVPFA